MKSKKIENINLDIDINEINTTFFKEFVNHIDSENHVTNVLFAQLHIEYILNSILVNGLYNYSKLNLDKLTFVAKINLLLALGYIDVNIAPPLLKLAAIRNKLAHNISSNLDKQDELDLINLINQTKIEKSKLNHRKNSFYDCVWILWLYCFKQLFKVISINEDINKLIRKIISTDPQIKINNVPLPFLTAYDKIITEKLKEKSISIKKVKIERNLILEKRGKL